MNTQRNALSIAYPRSAGLTLIEVLVALLILSIGILGLASLQTASLNFNAGASIRSQATVLAYDMADRMRANRQAALADDYAIAVQATPVCAAPNLVGTVAAQDISAWRAALACRLPQGTGSIVRNVGTDEFTLTVQWDDRRAEKNINEQLQTLQFTTTL